MAQLYFAKGVAIDMLSVVAMMLLLIVAAIYALLDCIKDVAVELAYPWLVEKTALVLFAVTTYNPRLFWTLKGLTYKGEREAGMEKAKSDRGLSSIVEVLDSLYFGRGSLLDVGCGYGYYLKGFQGYYPFATICGCDISPTMVSRAKKYVDDPCIVIDKVDGRTLPYSNKSFDITFTYGVCIHIPPDQIYQFISEILRVTRKHYVFVESSAGKHAFYYFSYDYPAIFAKLGIQLEVVKELGDTTKLYVASLVG